LPASIPIHERRYRWTYLGSVVHRARLRLIQQVICRNVTTSTRTWADFGCSNGFVIEHILRTCSLNFERVVGFDHDYDLLNQAKRKKLTNVDFMHFELNHASVYRDRFQLLTCFETMEHLANYHRGLENLYSHLEPGGLLILSVPNETGLPGLVKFMTRYLVQRNPYGDFFSDSSMASYVRCLLSNSYIDVFRESEKDGYDPHLGFDHRRFFESIKENFVHKRRLVPVETKKTFLGMNVVSVYRKTDY
jgi:trans-aconitate methyltransferase